jgi:hypothetical protein
MVLPGSDTVDSSRKNLLNVPEAHLIRIYDTKPPLREVVIVVYANYLAYGASPVGMTAKRYVLTMDDEISVVPGFAKMSDFEGGAEFYRWKMSEFPTLIHAS